MSNNLIRVAATSSPHRVAGAIAQQMRAEKQAEVQAIGPVAVNQMLKAVIIARTYLQLDQIQPVCVPSFVEVSVDGQPRTAVHLCIFPNHLISTSELSPPKVSHFKVNFAPRG